MNFCNATFPVPDISGEKSSPDFPMKALQNITITTAASENLMFFLLKKKKRDMQVLAYQPRGATSLPLEQYLMNFLVVNLKVEQKASLNYYSIS
mgnify:CR=1 FL=1